MTAAPRVSIRMAEPRDAAQLAEMRYRFRAEITAAIEPEDRFVARCRLWMESRLEGPSGWRCWVAERDGELVAHLWIELFEKLPNPAGEPEWHAYLTNFYVDPELRNRGLGALLMRAALDWSAENGIDAILLRPSDRSRPFYRRHGFAPSDEYFLLKLPRGSS